MIGCIGLLVGSFLPFYSTHRSFLLENLALRQQLEALKRNRPKPRLSVFDKLV